MPYADDPHTKTSLLLQAHLDRLPLPISDYVTDTKTVLDNSIRILQAIVDVCADAGWVDSTLAAMRMVQALVQARWYDADPLMQLPHATPAALASMHNAGFATLPQLVAEFRKNAAAVTRVFESAVGREGARAARAVLDRLPVIEVSTSVAQVPAAEAEGNAHATFSWALEVDLQRVHGKSARGGAAPRVYAPSFPKIKEEGWWLVAADASDQELLALKRVSFGQHSRMKLVVPAITADGQPVERVRVHLVCDSYLGMDQAHDVMLKI